jgi:outer membrane protein assembly factor BamA
MLQYNAAFISVFKNTDLIINGNADMKGNILNYFGRGNNTLFDQNTDFRRYYRVNFSYYQLDPVLRFTLDKSFNISIGPSFQHYKYDPENNSGRYITELSLQPQLTSINKEQSHGGLVLNLNWDRRDDKFLPTKGINFSVKVQGYEGLNKNSSSYAQVFPQFSFYKSLDSKGKVVLANRTGGAYTTGKTAFYQSAFLGSQDNLLGFRKFRFAGDNVVYNNLEARIQLPNFLHYRLPGKIGLIGFYDAGRVWIDNESSNTIHHGYGGGVFLAPFNKLLIRAVAGFSNERMQLSVALRQRF